jgi:hypothetical protein
MDRLAITAITDVILASELFFLAGMMVRTPKARGSAAWFWAAGMLALATSALLGGIDHGFVESAGLDRFVIQRGNWMIVGIAMTCVLLATARQFLSAARQPRVAVIAVVQYIVYVVAVVVIGEYLVVIAWSAAVLLLLLGLSVRGLPRGTGSWTMIVGVLLVLIASVAQALRVDVLAPLDHDGLYHLISMVGVVFLYLGGQRLQVGTGGMPPSPEVEVARRAF